MPKVRSRVRRVRRCGECGAGWGGVAGAVNVLVTGATGFTGGHLATTLARRGYKVRALVRPKSLERFRISGRARRRRAGDRRSHRSRVGPSCRRRRAGRVSHRSDLSRGGAAGQRVCAINVDGTRNVLDAAKSAGARRVVHCSTGGVHGHIEAPPATEDAPLRPGDVYQETKLEAETLARAYGQREGSRRGGGPADRHLRPGDTRFLKMFRGIARGRFPVLGSGEMYYHLSFIDDLVEGFRLCGETPAAAGRTYVLAGPRYTTLNELLALMAQELRCHRRGCICRCGRSG